MAFPDAWNETALIGIQKLGGSEVQFAAITDTIDIGEGDYPGEGVPTLAGGRIWKQSPKEDGEITLELFPIELDTTTGVGLFQQFTGGTYDTSEPLASDVAFTATDRLRDQFRIVILWSNDGTASTASGATAASTDSIRYSAMGCRLISHKASYTDGILKVTATFKYPAFNKAGTVKMDRWDSGDDTALAALSTYDDADNWS